MWDSPKPILDWSFDPPVYFPRAIPKAIIQAWRDGVRNLCTRYAANLFSVEHAEEMLEHIQWLEDATALPWHWESSDMFRFKKVCVIFSYIMI